MTYCAVNHDVLLKKLENKYGKSGLELDWFTSYMQERKQFCKANSISSGINDLSCGVPQGSFLGLFLFLIYMSDLQFCLSKGRVTTYNDNTMISNYLKCISKLQDELNQDLEHLWNRLHGNELCLSAVETQSSIIGSKPNTQRFKGRLKPSLGLKQVIKRST